MKKKKTNLENPLMKDNKKVKKIKAKDFNVSEEGNEIKSFIIIVIVIAVIAGIVYIATEVFSKNSDKYEKVITEGSVKNDLVTVGTLLNRSYNDYYVLVYDADSTEAVLYSTILTKYVQNNSDKDNYKKIYFCDLSNALNKDYYNVNDDNKSNLNATKTEEFDFGDLTLLEIKNGKVEKYIEDYTTIQELLK